MSGVYGGNGQESSVNEAGGGSGVYKPRLVTNDRGLRTCQVE